MTPTLKLRLLALENFGPFVGKHTLELPPNGLHMVLGENQDTDESSGAGKSSLVESLAYAFDYSAFAATELKSWDWLTKEPLSVGLVFDTPAGQARLGRGKKVTLEQEGQPEVTSSKAVKEHLTRLVGVQPEILKALTYRPQGQPGLFLSMTDQEKKSFLTELLGLQAYEVSAESTVETIGELTKSEETLKAVAEGAQAALPAAPVAPSEPDLSDLSARYKRLGSEVESAEETLRSLRAADTASTKSQGEREAATRAQWEPHVSNLSVAVAMAEGQTLSLTSVERPSIPAELATLRERLSLLRKAIAKAKADHQEKLKGLRYDVADERNSFHSLRSHAQGQAQVAEAERTRLVSEVAVLEKQECDRCHRPWSDAAHARMLAEKRAGIEGCDVVLKAAAAELELAHAAERRMKELDLTLTFEQSADPVPEKLAKGELEYAQKVVQLEAEYKTAVAEAERRHDDQVRLARAEKQRRVAEAQVQLSKAETDYMSALHKAAEMTPEHVRVRENMAAAKDLLNGLLSDRRVVSERIESAKALYRSSLAQFERERDSYAKAKAQVDSKVEDWKAVLRELDRERDYLGCVRSFLGVIFDETLNRIAYLTNERLAKVPNVQGLTLRFVSERETKTTKNMRQEIRPIVERDGHEIPLKRTSGGQYTAVELAVDLSLADVIAERTGVMPGWLILDEAFNGLPVKSKTACLELLKDAATTRLILVIDHATEFKELFDSTFIVRSRDGRSSFA
jgi:DNA repair exonuclease SbcCD ATPase subunit